MGLRNTIGLLPAAILPWAGNGVVCGGFMEFTDKDEWIAAVGDFTTIGFTGFPDGTFITDQYADLGILFTDGNDSVSCCSKVTFPEDGAGLDIRDIRGYSGGYSGDIRDSHLFTSPLSSPFIKVCSPLCVCAWVVRRQALAVDPLPPCLPALGPLTGDRMQSLDISTG